MTGRGEGRLARRAGRARACRIRRVPSATRGVGGRQDPRGKRRPPVRVVLTDDSPAVRAGLSRLLGQQPDMEVVGEAADGLAAVAEARRLHPDVVVMDVSMPGGGGLLATRRIGTAAPTSRVIAFSVHEDPTLAAELVEAGAFAYLSKAAPPALLLATIRACMDRRLRGGGRAGAAPASRRGPIRRG